MTHQKARLQKETKPARAAPARAQPPPAAAAQPVPAIGALCVCGGGCPRCSRAQPRASGTGDPLEQAAERRAHEAARDPSQLADARRQARIHVGPAAAAAAAAFAARAFTIGRDIVFGAGEHQPTTAAGRHLLAHELAHVEQQTRSGQPMIQRDGTDVVDMDPITVRSALRPVARAVPDLGNLRGAVQSAGDVVLQHADETVARNAPAPTQRLPFAPGGWDAQAILTALGQYDDMPETDSDALRCVQAVAMAARVVDGPAAVNGYLRAMIMQGMLSRPQNPRERTAIDVLDHVIARIETERATFGDMLWAQEALHDLFYNDVSGTPGDEIHDQIRPALELFGRNLERMDVWCNDPQDVITAASALQPGEQLLVNTWQVVFNLAFDQLEEEHDIHVREGRSTVIEVNGRRRRIRRIPTDTRPAHTAIDEFRDSKQGHQLLVMRDSVSGQVRLYEPEITTSGRHLEDLATDGSNFQRYFRDLPDVGAYNYIQILGKLTPNAMANVGPGGAP